VVERSHLSIGEVLSLLREEFPDVTISKIRFLESQGLVDPERTPSGYRKFYEHDVERLRWILRQQRENFLPLKVIRGRLTEGSDPDSVAQNGGDSALAAFVGAGDSDDPEPHGGESADGAEMAASAPVSALSRDAGEAGEPNDGEGDETDQTGEASPAVGAVVASTASSPSAPAMAASGTASPPSPRSGGTRAPTERRRAAPARPAPSPDDAENFSADELAAAAGGTPLLISELQEYGLIRPQAVVAGTPYFDETALTVARAAAGFAAHGVEARHLRSWRNAADREAGIFEQIVTPLLRQRNPEARRQALDTLAELTRLGADLRTALIERALREIR
jgi:DNA-binding transcriptional MerR regulator